VKAVARQGQGQEQRQVLNRNLCIIETIQTYRDVLFCHYAHVRDARLDQACSARRAVPWQRAGGACQSVIVPRHGVSLMAFLMVTTCLCVPPTFLKRLVTTSRQ
jgi:hypothetical protein